jgi:hypothetical protein
MELWVILLLLAAGCIAIGIFEYKIESCALEAGRQPRLISLPKSAISLLKLPGAWIESSMTIGLNFVGSYPRVFQCCVESLKQRFIFSLEARTAQARASFIRTQIEELSLIKGHQDVFNNLQNIKAEHRNGSLKLALEHNQLATEYEESEALRALRLELKRLTLEVEIKELLERKRSVGRGAEVVSRAAATLQTCRDRGTARLA